jgi:uncharacterized protein YjbI with pentapeptide repeats
LSIVKKAPFGIYIHFPITEYKRFMRKLLFWLVIILPTIIILGFLTYGIIFPGSLKIWVGTNSYYDNGKMITPPKTIWDLLDLIMVPIALIFVAYWLNLSEKRTEAQQLEEQNQRIILQDYFAQIRDFILEKNLLICSQESALRKLARTITKITLHEVNGSRRGIIIRFLYESGLVSQKDPIIFLSGSDCREAELSYAMLQEVTLIQINGSGTIFSRANLSMSRLNESNFSNADFSSADLRNSNISRANLSGAKLTNTNFEGANLIRANLENATMRGAIFKNTKLNGVKYNSGTIWPEDFDYKLLNSDGVNQKPDYEE